MSVITAYWLPLLSVAVPRVYPMATWPLKFVMTWGSASSPSGNGPTPGEKALKGVGSTSPPGTGAYLEPQHPFVEVFRKS